MTREIRLPAPHPLFRPRLEPGMRRPGHPGTAVRMGEDLYEVVAAEMAGGEWVYRLEPWTGRDTIRGYVEWGEGSEREFTAALREERAQEQKNFLAWGAQAFLGFLPARYQERLQDTRALNPTRATFWSATLEAAVACPVAVVFVINSIAAAAGSGGLGGSIPAWAGLLAIVALGEGVFRLVAVVATGHPIGSLFLVPLDLRLRSGVPRFVRGDEILTMGESLEIISPVPKVWWENAGGVTYGGEPYLLVKSDREKAKFVYRFRKGGAGFPVLDPELEKVRNAASDLSYVFAPLWGFLPADLQESLDFYGRYNPRPNVILSIGFNLLLAVAFVGPGLRNVSRGIFEIGSLVLFAAALVLFAESIVRLVRLLGEGRTTGSLLAFLVKPVYNWALRGGRRSRTGTSSSMRSPHTRDTGFRRKS